jgi:hypothetical protein
LGGAAGGDSNEEMMELELKESAMIGVGGKSALGEE